MIILMCLPITAHGSSSANYIIKATDLQNNMVRMDFDVSNFSSVYGAEVYVAFDKNILKCEEVINGNVIMADDSKGMVVTSRLDNEAGRVIYVITKLGESNSDVSSGTLFSAIFTKKTTGDYKFRLDAVKNTVLSDKKGAGVNITLNLDQNVNINKNTVSVTVTSYISNDDVTIVIYEKNTNKVAYLNQKQLVNGSYTFVIPSLANGTYYGSVTAHGEKISISDFNVLYLPITKITLNKSTAEMKVDDTLELTAVIQPADATDHIIWGSSAPDVASVDSNGKVTALKAGKATITAKSAELSNISAACSINVSAKPSGGGVITDPVENPTVGTTPNPGTTDPTGQVIVNSKLNQATGQASATLSQGEIDKAFSQTKPDENGVKQITVDVAPVKGVSSYSVGIAAKNLIAETANAVIGLRTDIANVKLPANMLSNTAVKADQNIEFVVSKIDVSKLTADLQKEIGNRPVIDLSLKVDGKPLQFDNTNASVIVELNYTPSAEELKNPDFIVIWYLDENGKAIAIPNGRYDITTGKVRFEVTHFSRYAIAYFHKTFNDTGKSWAKREIEVMASKGVIAGTSSTTFTPNANITRGDFIKLLVKTLGLNVKADNSFNDVKPTDYYSREIAIAKQLGITTGAGNGMFKPKSEITRQEMMTMTARALVIAKKIKLDSNQNLAAFEDGGEVEAYAKQSVATMVKEQIITGSGNLINPKKNATRAEVAAIMYRVYKKYIQ